MSERRFTVAEANDALAEIVPLLETLRDAHARMEELHEDVMSKVPTNGGGAVHAEFLAAAEASEEAMAVLEDADVILRDPASGLIDFPAEREGAEVFLCFKLGEDAVAFWHPTDAGFAGRAPL